MNPSDRLSTLFEWPTRQVVHIVLPLMFVVALLAHTVGLAAFRLSPPNTEPQARRPATAYCLVPSPGASRAMEAAIAAADPALFSPISTEERGVFQLPPTDYTTALGDLMPGLRGMPAPPPPALPGVLPAGPLPPAKPATPGTKSPKPAPSTRISFSPELAARTPQPPALPTFSAPEKQGLLPASFLLAVDPGGSVLHVFPLSSSGFEDLDRSAEVSLHALKFPPSAATNPTWGTATFLWGADVLRLRIE